MKFVSALVVFLVLEGGCGFTPTAHAVQIVGDIQFQGSADLDNDSLGLATGVDVYADVTVASQSGDLAAVPVGTPVAMFAPWTFNSGPVANFWTADGFRLDLISSTVSQQSSSLLFVTGTGTLFGTNFDATPAVYTFTVTSADGTTPGGIYGFSASTATRPSPVPDGGSALALLGIALSGIELARRKLGAAPEVRR